MVRPTHTFDFSACFFATVPIKFPKWKNTASLYDDVLRSVTLAHHPQGFSRGRIATRDGKRRVGGKEEHVEYFVSRH